jgi:hypothetical protein
MNRFESRAPLVKTSACRAPDEGSLEEPSGHEARCTCGRLLALVFVDRVEVTCPRCRRTVSIPLHRREIDHP